MLKKYSFILENIQNDDNSLATNIGSAGAGLLASGYLSKLSTNPIQKYYTRDVSQLSNLDYLKGVKIYNKYNLNDYLTRNNLKITNNIKGGTHYNPRTHSINMGLSKSGGNKIGKSLFAHELGHSISLKNNPTKFGVYNMSKRIGGASALIQLINCFNKDDESRKRLGKQISIVGGVSSIPMIAEEINASIRGSKMVGLKGKDKAKAFMGIGSYIVYALSPTIIYGVSEGTRNLLKTLRSMRKKDPNINSRINNLKQQNIKVNINQ